MKVRARKGELLEVTSPLGVSARISLCALQIRSSEELWKLLVLVGGAVPGGLFPWRAHRVAYGKVEGRGRRAMGEVLWLPEPQFLHCEREGEPLSLTMCFQAPGQGLAHGRCPAEVSPLPQTDI